MARAAVWRDAPDPVHSPLRPTHRASAHRLSARPPACHSVLFEQSGVDEGNLANLTAPRFHTLPADYRARIRAAFALLPANYTALGEERRTACGQALIRGVTTNLKTAQGVQEQGAGKGAGKGAGRRAFEGLAKQLTA